MTILTTQREAASKLPLMSSQLGVDLGAEIRHVAARDEKYAETWRVHSKRYEREPDAAPFYANRPRGRGRGAGRGRGGGARTAAKRPGRGSAKARRRFAKGE